MNSIHRDSDRIEEKINYKFTKMFKEVNLFDKIVYHRYQFH